MKTCFLSIDVELLSAHSDKISVKEDGIDPIKKFESITEILKKHKVNATLFVTGEILEHYSDMVKKWAEDFEIGCHNYYHVPLDKTDVLGREKQLKDFIEMYKNTLSRGPEGFRAPRNIIDNEQFPILERHGFVYDSSVLPRYPLGIRHYAGYRGKAPIKPYWPDKANYRKRGCVKIMEIPEAPAFFSVPLVGTWLRKLGTGFFKFLFIFKKPGFISFSMHSWDGVEFVGRGSKNSGKAFFKQLDEMLELLKQIGYEFKSGKQVYEEFFRPEADQHRADKK